MAVLISSTLQVFVLFAPLSGCSALPYLVRCGVGPGYIGSCCPEGFCCSLDGYCGTGVQYCVPDICQADVGQCYAREERERSLSYFMWGSTLFDFAPSMTLY